jgi:predicted DNA binding CopG/RHH family protein
MTKSFKENLSGNLDPVMQFISVPEMEKQQQENEPLKRTYKTNPFYIETKIRRVQLLLQPSLYAKVKAKAILRKSSINEYIHSILEDTLNEKEV